MVPYNYGGKVWYKDAITTYWTEAGSMYANGQYSNGAEYSGNQLGAPDWPIKTKGCAYVHADIGSGSDKRIIMSYMYNPQGKHYTISMSYGGLGITYESGATVYTSASTIKLTY